MGISESMRLDERYRDGITVVLKQGMGWAIYSDDGPSGPCAQSMDITCPHTKFMTWPDESSMLAYLDNHSPRNKKHRLVFGVVGQYTVTGVMSVEIHDSGEGSKL